MVFPTRLVLIVLMLLLSCARQGVAKTGPTLLMDTQRSPRMHVGAGGMNVRYKRVSGPLSFGGDMLMYGLRGYGGKLWRKRKLLELEANQLKLV